MSLGSWGATRRKGYWWRWAKMPELGWAEGDEALGSSGTHQLTEAILLLSYFLLLERAFLIFKIIFNCTFLPLFFSWLCPLLDCLPSFLPALAELKGKGMASSLPVHQGYSWWELQATWTRTRTAGTLRHREAKSLVDTSEGVLRVKAIPDIPQRSLHSNGQEISLCHACHGFLYPTVPMPSCLKHRKKFNFFQSTYLLFLLLGTT